MKINLNKTILAISVCTLTSIASADDQAMQMSGTRENMNANHMADMTDTAQGFVWMAGTTDMKEVHMGKLALQKSENADVKSFAKDIVADHKKACKKLQAIAEKEGLNFPSTNSMAVVMNGDRWNTNYNAAAENNHPDKERQNMDTPPHLASLLVSNANDNIDNEQMTRHEMVNWDTLSGAEFDRAFVSHMIAGHENAISKFEMASANLQDPALKKYANKTLPTLRKHLKEAQELQSKVGMRLESDMTNSAARNISYQNR